MKACKMDQKLRRATVEESQRHLCTVREKFMRRYHSSKHDNSKQTPERNAPANFY